MVPARLAHARRHVRLGAILAVLAAMAIVTGSLAGAQVPGTPGEPQTPVPVYEEDFENANATSGIRLGQYTGGPAANNSTYLASPAWSPVGDQCNGWILNFSTPLNSTVTSVDQGCDTIAWTNLRRLATAIGLSRGEELEAARTNQILSAYTNGGANPGPGVQLQTAVPITQGIIPGHFYLVSAVYAAENCEFEGPTLNRGDPSLTFRMILNQTGNGPAPGTGTGTLLSLATGLNPCTDPAAETIAVGGLPIHVAQLNSASFRATPETTSLGIQLFNASGAFRGNDSGFDDPSIVDATPQLDKEFSPTTLNVGETTTLTFTITNTDDLQAKTGWSFSDDLPEGLTLAGAPSTNCPGGVVTPTETGVTAAGNLTAGLESCTVTVPVTSATDGTFTNDADNVALDGLWAPGTTTVVFNEVEAPDITLVKSADLTDPADFVVGREVNYSFLVTNTGNVPLSDVDVTEGLFTGSGPPPEITCPPETTLQPSNSVECTATYTLTQADVDVGSVTNAATTTGTSPAGTIVTDDADLTISGSPAPSLELVKLSDPSALQSPPRAGDLVTFTFTVTNNGNVTLTDVSVDDQLAGLSDIAFTFPGADGVLTPGQSVTGTATYAITQADIDAGRVENLAIATGTPPAGGTTSSELADTLTPLEAAPALLLAKAAIVSLVRSPAVVGDTITYNFTLTNTGNVTLTGVDIADQLPGLSAITPTWPGPEGVLAPGEVATATATYEITQADIDAGQVANSALAEGTTPDEAITESNPADVVTPLAAAPSISLLKTADASDIQEPAVVGDTITYRFTATNSGNVTLNGVTIADQLPGLSELSFAWLGIVGELSPGEQVTATATYRITQADIDVGRVINLATATGSAPDGTSVASQPVSTDTPLTSEAPGPGPTPPTTPTPTTPAPGPAPGPAAGPAAGRGVADQPTAEGGALPLTGTSSLVLVVAGLGLIAAGTIGRAAGRLHRITGLRRHR
jgi:uncharacterized repeat protein (TIGR01451 family)